MNRMAIVLVLLASAPLSAADVRPNVVIVLVDDFGWGDPSCYGNTMVKTPNMDRLAKEGIRFTQGYVASPICSPSRCGLITGQYPARWKITSYLQAKAGNKACEMADYLDPQAPMLPRLLKDAGYKTAHVGKWHLGGGRDVLDAPKFAAYGYDLGLGTYESPEPAAPLGLKTVPWGPQNLLEPQQVPRHQRSKWMVDQTLDFLKKHPDSPCFVNLWLDDTHTPFAPSEAQMVAVKAEGDTEQKTRYKAVLVGLDEQIGRLLDGLKGTNTLVLFFGDNGASPPFERERGAGLRGQKLSLYEGGVRVPMVAWWPAKVTGGSVNDKTVLASLDFLPTLAKICGAPLPKGYAGDGEDLSAAIRGETPLRTKPIFWEYGRNNTSFAYPMNPKHRSPNLAVREGQWKLLIQADGTGAELYDLATDPNEAKDLAANQPEVTKRLSEAVLVWRKGLSACRLTIPAHDTWVSAVAWSPDGKSIASASSDDTLILRDADTGKERLRLRGQGKGITALAYSPDGKSLATGNWNGTLTIRDAATGDERVVLRGHTENVTAIAYSPDGTKLATGSGDDTLRVWDARTGKVLLALESANEYDVTAVAFSPDGKVIVSGDGEDALKLWDAQTGRELLTLEGHTAAITAVAFSPDGRHVASASRDQTIRLWHSGSGKEVATLRGHTDEVTSVAFSPDGRRIASGSDDDTLRLWTAEGKPVATLTGHSENIASVAFSPDGKQIVTASKAVLKVWLVN